MQRFGAMTPALDRLDRPLGSLRVSVTDRCNLRCRYCMPEDDYVWLPRASILSFEEIARLVAIFTALGVTKVRITGGEPLLRRELPRLVEMLRHTPGVADLALTTNGVLLSRYAPPLRAAGLHRVTVSLDTLRPDRFRALTGSDHHADALWGIDALQRAGFARTKLNTVVMRGFNDDEVLDLLAFARERELEIRFIEYMDVGGATRWSPEQVVSCAELLARVQEGCGAVEAITGAANPRAPAERFRLADGTTFGIIASTTEPFCRSCDRSRITADGMWFLCLYAAHGVDLKTPLRAGASDAELAALIRRGWEARADRGAEERLALPHRAPLYQLDGLRADPHREMHTRGG